MGTIADLNELTIPSATLDYMLVRTTSATDKDKKMKLGVFPLKYQTPTAGKIVRWRDANTVEDSGIILLGSGQLSVGGTSSINGVISGGGSLALTGASAISSAGTLALGGFTFTVPATGTGALKTGAPTVGKAVSWLDASTLQDAGYLAADVARVNVANTFTLSNTFSAGINLGQSILGWYQEGTFTPTDASGAGLTLSTVSGRYTRIGREVTCRIGVSYPSTASGAGAVIGGLPFVPLGIGGSNAGGGYPINQASFTVGFYPIVNTAAQVSFLTFAGAALTNADCSGKLLRFTVTYNV